ncbi:CBP80/20-dependent translation initiation factor-like [Gigantopelta aegis]|uniref:CBP80/20-dependent translation initiation factor-like n=1 Tax=Gigantopelta aegis TaxID=1735272 RepID=UPI001B8896C5|nr:CBP80/20-dependent translation initiation factor-like [Gigantopelta aegis]
MAGRGRGRGRGLLAAIKPQITTESGAGGDHSSARIIQSEIKSESDNATSQPRALTKHTSYEPSSPSPPTHGSFTSSFSTAPQTSTFMAASTSMSARSSFPLSSASAPTSEHSASASASTHQDHPQPASSAQRGSASAAATTTTTKGSGRLGDLEEQLDRLCVYDEDADDRDAMEIVQTMKALMCSSDDLKKASEMLYRRCVSDVNVAKTGALICNSLASIEVDGTKFRSCILSYLQKDFEGKDDLRRESSSRFLGFFTFLCQIFGEMRTATGEHFRPLITPIFHCVDLMLGVSDRDVQAKTKENADEIECILLQFQSVGKELENLDEEKMTKTIETIRMKIINNGTSPQIRCILLELVECYGRKFDQAPNDVTRFYCDTMAEILAGLVV